MKRKTIISEQDKSLFREQTKGIKRLVSDTVPKEKPKLQAFKHKNTPTNNSVQDKAAFHFSDLYQPQLPDEGPVRFVQEHIDKRVLKHLKRGDYQPELMLDLHGLTQIQAKRELSALLAEALRCHAHCVCVMTGHGKHILQQRLPAWLAQHPAVEAFHQAPKAWGGKAAFLVLIEVGDELEKY